MPGGTNLQPQAVLSAGPGVSVEQIYQYGAQNGIVTIGGYTQSVGITGGYLVGGGTGMLFLLYVLQYLG